ncbi:SDR family oxidoreductase [Yinghuangia sp. ASG 101]|uniref:SDR family NAD(P)-dependent oxidoreductase n=1 Tax=Yinghuangia sp. ASG 101 TaxID=2896848 RepID=UPI001E4D3C99|nr:SDR family oxidoreductase [Yinghuangia sp. ASG 101]UGQ12508.1 SDR family oxidoreductase [Yinghuangia sp. ASG 101]
MDLGLAGASAVVQGGTRGMGLAAAECFAEEGASVAVLSRTRGELDDTVARLRDLGAPRALGLRADITDAGEVEAAFRVVEERWGSLNILVNAAGPVGVGRFEDLADEDWQATLDLGAMGMIRCVRAALPLLRAAEWARIVNISAHSTKRQSATLVSYSAAKSVVTSVTKNLSLALAGDEILVNTVSPGSFTSPALRNWARGVGADPDDPRAVMTAIKRHFGHGAHLPRAGTPAEIGPVIAFVASRRNSYMTGANINVDGGSDFT